MSEFYTPDSIADALNYLNQENTMVCAGATNLYVDRHKGKYAEYNMVSLHRLEELKNITYLDGNIHIGSMVTFSDLEDSYKEGTLLSENMALKAIYQAASEVGGPQIRNRGTVGGNIISGSPAADSVPALLVLDALLIFVSLNGTFEIGLQDFLLQRKKLTSQKGILLKEIVLKLQEGASSFYKVGKRNALAISIINQALYAQFEDNKIITIKIAMGSVGPTTLRAELTEELLLGTTTEDWKKESLRAKIEKILKNDIRPITDIRASSEYRMRLANSILWENLSNVWREFNE